MLLALILLPLLVSLVLFITKIDLSARWLSFMVALVELGLVCFMLSQFVPNASTQFLMDFEWMPTLGIRFKLGVDGISMSLLLLTTLLTPLIILTSFKNNYKQSAILYALVLLMQSGLILVFCALDAFLFYVGWEVALVPIYFICTLWGGENRIRVNLKFFIYTILGSLLMLLGIIYIHLQTQDASYSLSSFYNTNLTSSEQGWLFGAFFIAFAIKIPVFPFHTWQPDTYTEAPTVGTMLLSGIMLKMGIYGIIRFLLPILPLGMARWGDTAMILAAIGIVYASLIAFTQKDAKRLIAYSSIAHVGLITAGVLSFNVQGLQGAIIQMLNHGLSAVGLFLLVDIIERSLGTRSIERLGGIAKVAPKFAVFFLIILLGAVAMPLTNGFVGEFLLLSGIYQYNSYTTAVVGLSVIFGAVYMLRMYQNILLGELNTLTKNFVDVSNTDFLVLAIIASLTLIIGIYPKPLLMISESAVQQLILQVGEKLK